MKRLHPTEKIFMMCVVVLASTILLVTKIDAQDQATPNPTPLSGEAAWVFPTTLFCEDIGSYENGPKWEDIQIGESQLSDLIKKIELFSFEGMAQRPMSLNGYSWVEGNPVR